MAGNDVAIIAVILVFFLSVATVLPFINESFVDQGILNSSDTVSEFFGNVTDFTNATSIEHKEFSIWDPASYIPNEILFLINVLWLFIKITFWGFGTLNFWLNMLLFWPLRLILIFTIARNIWVGGGG